MPIYRVYTTSTVEGLSVFTIQDARTLREIASELGANGHVLTTDVTEHRGRELRPKPIALFPQNIVAMHEPDEG
jgi:hypothetical protein